MYIERTMASTPQSESAPIEQAAVSAAPAKAADQPRMSGSTGCGGQNGRLPGNCAAMAFPYVPMQDENLKRYDNREALQRGTLFPGLDLPFHRELKTRFPAVNTHLSELMALDFAIDELGLYLTTHRDDQEALALYWNYIRLGQEGRRRYEEMHGPLFQTDITEGSFKWLDDPWPWDEGGNA